MGTANKGTTNKKTHSKILKLFVLALMIIVALSFVNNVSADSDRDYKGDNDRSDYKFRSYYKITSNYKFDDDRDDGGKERNDDYKGKKKLRVPVYSWRNVQKHNKPTNCWIVLFKNVYDITPLIQNYGFTLACGVDHTVLYTSMYGSNLTMMKPYYKGIVVGKPSNSSNSSLPPPVVTPPPVTPQPLSINPISAKTTTVGTAVTFTASASGGTSPISYSLTGTVPSGASINSATGAFSWTPSATGVYNFNARATDAASASVSTPVTITVNAAPIPTYTLSQVQTHNTNSNCWVILFNKVYDITPLVQSHSGGNVFQCGTDMTTTYQAVHGTNLNRMSSYFKGNLV